MKYLPFLQCFILLFTFSACSDKKEGESYSFNIVTKVSDGDTFWVDNGTEKGMKVRLIGIDAPEPRNVFKKKQGYYGKESSAYLKELIFNKPVHLEYDIDSLDQFGRTLAYAYLEDGTFLNAQLIELGFAKIMTVPPNVKYADDFYKLQIKARTKKRGLWAKEIQD